MTLDEPQLVLALDPGETVGWAKGWYLPNAKDAATSHSLIDHGYTPWRQFCKALHADVMNEDNIRQFDVFVYETFRLYADKADEQIGSTFPTAQCVGCIWLCSQVGVHKANLRDQGAAIKNVIDARMGGTGYLPKSDVEHNRDAIRHLFFYCQKQWTFEHKKGTIHV